jgi:light-regulated signal transduction histidine kinase (bacteriophytochrome)
MRTLWNILSTIAVANLLALVGFVSWLVVTDRLTSDRVEIFRSTLSETVQAEQVRLDQEADDVRIAADEAEAEMKAQLPPISAADRLLLNDESEELARQRLQRVHREVTDLQRTLRDESAQVALERAALDLRKTDFEAMRQRIAQIEGDAQFTKTVKLYESLKPDNARDLFQQLIDKKQTAQVVAYLNAMQQRAASKIIASFEDPNVAAGLLESIRVYGLEARTP